MNLKLPFDVEPLVYTKDHLNRVLSDCAERGVSDLIFASGNPVSYKYHGLAQRVGSRLLTEDEMRSLMNSISSNGGSAVLSGRDYDFRYEVIRPNRGGYYRFRVNITQTLTGASAIFRSISDQPLPVEKLNVEPELLRALINVKKGLVLVTGPTGSGKTTLLSSVLRERLLHEHIHLVTFESPIEYVYHEIKGLKGVVSQTEIPSHIESFANAVRGSLRRAPDVVLVGEARDRETISGMVNEVRTGHAVYSTTHTESVAGTIDRVVNEFPPEESLRAKMAITDSLQLVVHQRLVAKKGGGRVPLKEWLEFNTEIRDKVHEIPIQRLAQGVQEIVMQYGQPMQKSAVSAYQRGLIEKNTLIEVLYSIGVRDVSFVNDLIVEEAT